MIKSILIFATITFTVLSGLQELTDKNKGTIKIDKIYQAMIPYSNMEHIRSPTSQNTPGSDVKQQAYMKSLVDGSLMHNGKMMLVTGDRITRFGHNMTMTNGTTIMLDGSYMELDGTKVILEEGDHIDMKGNIKNISNLKSNN